MSTDCYAVVFEDGATAIIPVRLEVLITDSTRTRWQFVDANGCAMERPLSQVWHCPSPVEASRLLMHFKDSDIHPSNIPHDCVLICRNPAPKEKP